MVSDKVINKNPKWLLLLRASVALIFLGRAYQYFFWDAPFRTFLWDEDLLSPFVENVIGISWHEYVTHPNTDMWIETATRINGVIYFFALLATLSISRVNYRTMRYPIYAGTVLLLIMALLEMKDSFYHSAQFFEYSIQFGSPFLFLQFLRTSDLKALVLRLKILIALTFTAHGLYALGYYPVPGHFVDMTISCLGVDEDTARYVLYGAGAMDLLLSILLFLPKTSRYALIYAACWGLLTALARVFAHTEMEVAPLFHQYLYQVVYRLPHAGIPLVVYSIITRESK